jgi:flavin-dependent thymidylate synthase
MKIWTEPKVAIICRPLFSQPDHLRVEWVDGENQGTASGWGASLVEYAGRLCYMSQANPSGKTTAQYIENILKQGHGCYDSETEVLTVTGWKRWPDVSADDRLATRTAEGVLEYHKPTALISAPYRGRMYRVEARGVDLLVTPNHNMLVCPTTTKEGRKKTAFQLLKAEDLGDQSHAYVKTASWPAPDYGADLVTMKMLGFAIGDAYCTKGSSLQFRLRRDRKIVYLKALCEHPEWDLKQEGDRFTVYVPEGLEGLFRQIYDENREKQIPQWVLSRCSKTELEALLEGLMASDGHVGRTGRSFDTTSQELVGQVQQLCLHVGLAANVCYTYSRADGRRQSSYGSKPLTRLSIISRELKPEVNKCSGAVGRSQWVEDWEGPVYCAEVPNHTLYVRRNGIPVWCGNSVLEHASWSLLIEGVSRSLTHELVRHRAGTAFSQLSQRYVEHVEGVAPPAVIKAGLLLPWTDRAREVIQAYMAQLDALRANGLTGKALKEAARSLLPNCAETKIVMTANARAWRHVIELRSGEGADAEIRRLFRAVLAVLKAEAPALFGDFDENGVPKYSKV